MVNVLLPVNIVPVVILTVAADTLSSNDSELEADLLTVSVLKVVAPVNVELADPVN